MLVHTAYQVFILPLLIQIMLRQRKIALKVLTVRLEQILPQVFLDLQETTVRKILKYQSLQILDTLQVGMEMCSRSLALREHFRMKQKFQIVQFALLDMNALQKQQLCLLSAPKELINLKMQI
jgi:hypothetical protein